MSASANLPVSRTDLPGTALNTKESRSKFTSIPAGANPVFFSGAE
jgi:hypothetical protein